MAEYTANELQTVAVGANVLFTDTPRSGGCYIRHREGAGIFTLRGGHDYTIAFGANVTGATAGVQVDLAIALSGEEVPATRMASTPSTANYLNNVGTAVSINVPCGCCYTVSVRNVGTTALNVQNANLIIRRED